MSTPAMKSVKVRVQRFVTATVDSIKINGSVWWPTLSTSMNPREFKIVDDVNKPVLLFVHQWSKMGGAGQLMEGMAYTMALKNHYTAVTFDMRGAGDSSGVSTWSGSEEVNDVLSVAQWIKLNIAKPIVIIGSSAGAPIAGSAFGDLTSNYMISGVFIGYPFGFLSSIIFGKHYSKITASHKPKLFIMGDSDGFTSVKQLKSYVKKCKGNINESYIEKDIGHFGLESPAFDDVVCELIHQFITSKVCDNIDVPFWHDTLSREVKDYNKQKTESDHDADADDEKEEEWEIHAQIEDDEIIR
eukprot:480942_1